MNRFGPSSVRARRVAPSATRSSAHATPRRVTVPLEGPAGRVTVIVDPAGAVFGASERRLHKGAQIVNEPGAWSMSRLETPDPDGAQVFYAALFGWTTEASDIGETRITMFRLPAYVGSEPEQAFSLEVVATMSDVTDDDRQDHDAWPTRRVPRSRSLRSTEHAEATLFDLVPLVARPRRHE